MFILLAVILMGIGLFVSAYLAVLINDWATLSGEAWLTGLAQRPDRVFRRVLMIFGGIVLFGLVRRFGWLGFRDCGWQNEDGMDVRAGLGGLLIRGFMVGALTMGAVRIVAIVAGFHALSSLGTTGFMITCKILQFAGSAIVVGVLEETVCRGIMYRVLARNSGIVTGALVSSVIFALAHFISPTESAFATNGGVLARSVIVVRSVFAAISETEAFWIRFINLALIGFAMCGLFVKTGSIWMSVACHGAWVLIIKVSHYLTDYMPTHAWSRVLGMRTDATDSPVIAIMLAGLAIWGFAGARQGGVKNLKKNGLIWRVFEKDNEHVASWLNDHRGIGNGAITGNILKSYNACIVVADDGVVLKRRVPSNLFDALRSWFTPCRTRRAFESGRRLVAAGVPVDEPLAWTAWRSGLARAEALLTREISGVVSLDRMLPMVLHDARTRHELLMRYAELAAAFHMAGFSNRDLKDENVLVSADAPFKLWAVDLDGVRWRRRVTRRRSARDLYRIGRSLHACGCATPGDARVFFETYNRLLPGLAREAFPE